MNAPSNLLPFLYFSLFFVACTKKSDLEQIPDSSLLTIKTIEDARALLDNTVVMRETPALTEVSADNFYLSPDFNQEVLDPIEVNAYLWKSDIFEGKPHAGDWLKPYQQVYYANSVLLALPRLADTTNKQQLNEIKGTALFIRAYAFYNVVLEFASLYSNTANSDAGIPLRLTADPLAQDTRATVKETYDFILSGIKDAARLLPNEVDANRKNRPSVPAAFALLSRIYLSMGEWANAKKFADSCLNRYNQLMDFHSMAGAISNPFNANNEEVLYQSNLLSTTDLFNRSICHIDSSLFNLYADQDIRRELFFSVGSTGLPMPRFSYSGDLTKFSGLAIDEVYLIRAECYARLGFAAEALQDITTLLKKRWKDNAYNPPPVQSTAEVLDLVLQERRKELVFRGLRWIDIRRLNLLNPQITLKRLVNKQEYMLAPGDKRYILPIPPDVIAKNTGILQNPR
jgi:starch-binding outer membrane protein, SusD/RagB family